MRVQIIGFGHKILDRKLRTLGERAKNPREGFLKVYERFREIEQVQFESLGTGPSGKWHALARRTILMKARSGYDLRPLHELIRLRPSLTRRGSRFAIFRTRGDVLVMGTSHPQADLMQRGFTDRGGNWIEPRPPIDLFDQDRRELVETFEDWLVNV